ncbi:hypothetical protein RYH80_13450 [Halobaculum sp. MBLA0147]|uniref:hypothetical protein n=1 Tax=Halobaculum sp. MBLA0147 TaxID=3079934 RepID=UPI0035245BC7
MPDDAPDLLVRALGSLGYETGDTTTTVEVEIVDRTVPKEDSDCVERVLNDECRTVIDHQVEKLRDIDDVAARTVRITVLVLAGILGTISLGESSGVSLTSPLTLWGGSYLLFSILAGMYTYNVSDSYLGPGRRTIEKWGTHDSESELHDVAHRAYAEWIEEMEILAAVNGIALDVTQLSLGLGLSYTFVSIFVQTTEKNQYTPVRTLIVETQGSLWHGLPLVLLVGSVVTLFAYSLWRF